jgi:hypothetical protein
MQDNTTPQAPPAPQSPAAPSATAALAAGTATPTPQTITVTDAAGVTRTLEVPRTSAELSALRQHRSEISSQLTSVSERRRELANEIMTTSEGASKQGLEARLKVLDQRILQLETDLANTGRLIALAPSEFLSTTSEPPQGGGDDFEEGMLAGGFFSLLFGVPLFYFFLRRRWRKRSGPRPVQDMLPESARRLERLEQGMESIAIEIERVSEGQRFVTRLLAEGQPGSTSRRVAEPAHLPTLEG